MKKFPALKAFTLVEIMIVISILAIVFTGLYISFRGSRSNQALMTSSEQLADVLRQAHIYSRQSKDSKTWGVKSDGGQTFKLYSRTSVGEEVYRAYNLDSTVKFDEGFEIWFDQGSGFISTSVIIKMQNSFERIYSVEVLQSGTVNITQQ